AALAQVGRGEVHRDSPRRVHEARVADGPAHAFPRLLQGSIRKADDREAGKAGRNVDLYADDPAVEAMQRRGKDSRQHAGSLSARSYLAVIWIGRRDLSAAGGRGELGRRGGHDLVDAAGKLEKRSAEQ